MTPIDKLKTPIDYNYQKLVPIFKTLNVNARMVTGLKTQFDYIYR